MRQVGIVFKEKSPQALKKAQEAVLWLSAHNVRALAEKGRTPVLSGVALVPVDELGHESSFIVCLGGDGTLLYGAGLVRGKAVPVLGINLGTLGFMTPFLAGELEEALEGALDGTLPVEERMRLRVTLIRREEENEGVATNDAVITQKTLARLMELTVHMDGKAITTYKSDGLIVSTPTGSTAYNLAAGGPILYPGLQAFCLTPICPHALTQRPLMLPASSAITVEVEEGIEEGMLTIDGQRGHRLLTGDRIRMDRSPTPLLLYRPTRRGFFDLLKTKLMWGERLGLSPSGRNHGDRP